MIAYRCRIRFLFHNSCSGASIFRLKLNSQGVHFFTTKVRFFSLVINILLLFIIIVDSRYAGDSRLEFANKRDSENDCLESKKL